MTSECEDRSKPAVTSAATPYRLEFKTQTFFSRIFQVQCAISIAVMALVLGQASSELIAAFSVWQVLLLVLVSAPLAVALSCLLRFLTWRSQPKPIEFAETGLRLPIHIGSQRVSELAYAQVTSLDIRQSSLGRVLVVGSPLRAFVYPVEAFTVPAAQLPSELVAGFSSTASALQCLPKLSSGQRLVDVLMNRQPLATYALVSLLMAVYLLEWMTGAASNIVGLTALGANVPRWVWNGELARLFTASFLHLNSLHLYVNVIGLLSLGAVLERLLGARKFLTVYLLSALGGSLSSTLFGSALLSVGASGALFGVLGALAVLNPRLSTKLPPGFVQTGGWWSAAIGMNVALALMLPAIDWRAHLGGFLAGAGGAYFLLTVRTGPCLEGGGQDAGVQKDLERWRASGSVDKWAVLVVIVMYALASLLVGLDYPAREEQVDRLLTELGSATDASESLANLVAWSVVLSPDSTEGHLQQARKVMEPGIRAILDDRATLRDKTKAAHLDTYASLLFLLGDYEQAAILERKALRYGFKRSFSSQFARFLQAYHSRHGVLLLGTGSTDGIEVARQVDVEGRSAVRLLRSTQDQGPLSVAISVSAGPERLGYFLCQFMTSPDLALVTDRELFNRSMADLSFTVQMIDAENLNTAAGERCYLSRVDGLDSIPR